jgi:tetratricopeptide (TPR) repeat protein
VKITLDSAALVKSGAVPAKYADKVLGSLDIDIRSNSLLKNDLMLLDFLAKNKFKRPIYFGSPAGVQSFDVSPYCFMEGYVYRFLPVKAEGDDFIKRVGSVNDVSSYDILMNKCKWGNLADPRVYVDPESYRNTFLPKQNFMRLAKVLVAESKNDMAIKVCDRVQEVFPDNKIHFDYYMIEFVDVYYRAGAIDKGNKLANRLIEIYEQNVDYYSSLNPEFRNQYSDDMNMAFSFFDYMKQIAIQNNQTAIVQRIEKYMNSKKGLM